MSALHLLAQERSPSKALQWPREVPRDSRAKLSAGHRGFHTCHEGNPRNLLHDQKIRVTNHLLIVVENGAVRIDRKGRRQEVRAGEAVLLSNTEFVLSEVVEQASNYGAFVLFFFEDDLLGRVPSPGYRAFGLLYHFGSHPCDEHMTVIPRPTVSLVSKFPADGFSQVLILLLRATYSELTPSLLKLVATRIVIPRLKIQLFAESMIFLPPSSFAARVRAYPEGAAVLRREIRRMGMGGIKKVVARCRRNWRLIWREKKIDRKKIWQAFHPHLSPAVNRDSGSNVTQKMETAQPPAVPLKPHLEAIPDQPEADTSLDVAEDLKKLQFSTLEEAFKPTNIIELPGLQNWREFLKAA